MERSSLVKAIEALAHGVRLDIIRLLVPEGPEGVTAGVIAGRLGLAPSGVSFHLGRLVNAGLVTCRREGRHLYYAVEYGTLAALVGFLTDDCCAKAPAGCLPGCIGAAVAGERTVLEQTGRYPCNSIP